jgi:hypothetical protein
MVSKFIINEWNKKIKLIGYKYLYKGSMVKMLIEFDQGYTKIGFDESARYLACANSIPQVSVQILSNSSNIFLNELSLIKSVASPYAAYLYLTKVLGYAPNHLIVNDFNRRNNLLAETSWIQERDNIYLSREQLLVMAFDYARDLIISSTNNSKCCQVSVSIPSQFDFFDRLVISKAAELANLSIYKWIFDNDSSHFEAFKKSLRSIKVAVLQSGPKKFQEFIGILKKKIAIIKDEFIDFLIHFISIINI